MSGSFVASMEGLRVPRMDAQDELCQRVGALWNGDQVDVIGHPTPAQQLNRARLELVAKQILVAAPVLVGQEDVLAIVAAVGDGMRHVDRHHPRLAGHQTGRF
jgi:hypothetical protein